MITTPLPRRLLLRFLIFLFSIPAPAQGYTLSPAAKISVLTCGTGNELYSLFGHTAIRIKDPGNGLDVVYNYGMFDFSTPNFGLKFVKGDMKYFVAAAAFSDFMIEYDLEKRSVVEQELHLPQEKKQALFDRLNAVLYSDERFYTYKFIDRNCTNMAMDAINRTLGGKVLHKRGDTQTSYRSIIFPYFHHHFYEQLGTSLCFGTKTDQPATTLFLPTELEYSLAHTVYQGHPIAQPAVTLLRDKAVGPAFSWWNNIFTFLVFLLAVLLVRGKFLKMFYLVLLGLLGVFFTFASQYSLHEELANNYNALLVNPLLLGVAVGYGTNRRNVLRIFTWASAAMLLVYLVWMIGKADFWIVLPIILTNAYLFFTFLKMPVLSGDTAVGVKNGSVA